MPTYLINEIKNVKEKRYLELGTFDGNHLNTVQCVDKTGVDTNGSGSFTGTTDEYFAQLDSSERFDLVYIDADHDCRSICKDFNNTLRHLSPGGSIFLHDLFPDTVELTAPHFCGTGYIFLDALLRTQYPRIYTMDGDYGQTLVHNPDREIPLQTLRLDLTYGEFRKEHNSYMRLGIEDLKNIVRSYYNG